MKKLIGRIWNKFESRHVWLIAIAYLLLEIEFRGDITGLGKIMGIMLAVFCAICFYLEKICDLLEEGDK